MSIINRMLKDLEKRGEPAASPSVAPVPRATGGSGFAWRHALLVLLAVGLLVLAAMLWLDRGPQLIALVEDRWRATSQEPIMDEPVESRTDTGRADNDSNADATTPVDTDAVVAAIEQEEAESTTYLVELEPLPESADQEVVEAETGVESAAEPERAAAAESTASEETETTAESSGQATEATAPAQDDTDSTARDDRGGEGRLVVRRDNAGESERRARRMYAQARDAWVAGDTSRARRLLTEALEHDPELHEAREMLVSAHLRVGNNQTAFDVLLQGLQLAPERVGFALPFARLLVSLEQFERAARVLDNAAVEGRGNAHYHAIRATVARRMGDHERAVAEYTRALEQEAGQGTWWIGLGISLAEQGHEQQAQAAFREARATGTLNPDLDNWTRGRIAALASGARE